MILYKILYGENSIVDITTTNTVDELKIKLASSYPARTHPWLSEEQHDSPSNYIYSIKNNSFKIYFSKQFGFGFNKNYPSFAGKIIDRGDERVIQGRIGASKWNIYLIIFWVVLMSLGCGYAITQRGYRNDAGVFLYLLPFLFLSFLLSLVAMRKKITVMKAEIDRLFYSHK